MSTRGMTGRTHSKIIFSGDFGDQLDPVQKMWVTVIAIAVKDIEIIPPKCKYRRKNHFFRVSKAYSWLTSPFEKEDRDLIFQMAEIEQSSFLKKIRPELFKAKAFIDGVGAFAY